MTQILRTQARIERTSGIGADAVVNTFHHSITSDTHAGAVAAAATIQTALGTFYTSVASLLSTLLVTPVRFKTYSLSEAEPRVPVLEGSQAITLGGGTPLPAEVALCLSYRAAAGSGTNPARRRGRIFLGPLSFNDTGSVVAGDMRPTATALDQMRAAGVALGASGAGPVWGVWSPTSLTFAPIVEVSTDNAFDTQRRRGAQATARTRSAVTP